MNSFEVLVHAYLEYDQNTKNPHFLMPFDSNNIKRVTDYGNENGYRKIKVISTMGDCSILMLDLTDIMGWIWQQLIVK